MRTRLFSILPLTVLAMLLLGSQSAYSQAKQPQPPAQQGNSPRLVPATLFGMNLYLTGLERNYSQATQLGTLAAQAGVKWSREELSWANIEPNSQGSFSWAHYDERIGLDISNGMEIVGMLLTTPSWASGVPHSTEGWYWYEPLDQQAYFDFVQAAVSRWKDRIHVWEIWNEPDVPGTWRCLNSCDRVARYATLLAGAYSTIKAEDPDARVLIGGLSVHDTDNGGMAFLDEVVADSGGAINFDALSIHTYMPDRVPESMEPLNLVQNFQYRLYMVNDWIDAHGGAPSEVWITEDGRSTCGTCPTQFRWTEDEQASMLARMYGIAAAAPRVVQFDYFQFEDKFDNPNNLYGGMAIVRDNLTVKPAYAAYSTVATMLDGATYTGMGPQMIPGNNQHQPDTSDWIGFDYRFVRSDGVPLHMVWRVNDSATVSYPAETAQVDVVDRDGNTTRMTASNGTVELTLGPSPLYVVNVACDSRFSDVCSDHWAYPYVECLASRDILGGYSDGTFRPNNDITRGQLSKVVSNAAGFNDPVSGQTFEDVPPGSTFYTWVQRMASLGIMSGYPCGGVGEPCGSGNRPYFRVNSNATRGQIAKIVSNAAGYSDTPAGQSFEDVPPSGTFYTWVQRLSSRGIMGGYPCGSPGEPCGSGNLPYFRPNNSATRAQVAKIVANTFFPECTAR
ncbi:MAG TPA: S-layer homology domain-containing protein [Chloroflexia bacterium]|nr:S-layer homology domain-containing protein [Chloroflexia bacterium]